MSKFSWKTKTSAMLGAAAGLLLTGCDAEVMQDLQLRDIAPIVQTETVTPGGDTPSIADNAALEQTHRLLEQLAVKGRAPKTGYARSLFGDAWTDKGTVEGSGNSCSTREDVLARDLTDIVYKPGPKQCQIQSGTLADPYTGTTILFVRGAETSSAVQIDHIVAMADAYQKGARQLSDIERVNFANDLRNLQAVDGPTNQQKGAGDAATWLPPNKAHRCTYVSQQVEVKAAYNLWVTQAEKDAILRVLDQC